MAAVNRKIGKSCSGNSYDNVINVFVDWSYVWVIDSLENENKAD